MATREELHRLIDSLPDDAIPAAHMSLTDFQTWPPPIPPELEERAAAMERRLRERAEMLRDEYSGSSGDATGLMTFSTAPGSQIRARDSFSYSDGGDDVHESAIVYDGNTFTLIERIRSDRDAHAISFLIELTGPDGTTARHEHRYGLP